MLNPHPTVEHIIVTGYAGHGKDEFCKILHDVSHGTLTYASSSETACRHFLFEALRHKYGYSTPEECMADRVNHRAEWFTLITEYNTPDKARLGTKIFQDDDVYCGLRNREELEALVARFNPLIIWIDAAARVGAKEPDSSMELNYEDAHIVVNNNYNLTWLQSSAEEVYELIAHTLRSSTITEGYSVNIDSTHYVGRSR